MKKAIKKTQIIKAYQLGANNNTEKQLIEEGVIKVLPDGRYELFSQESVNGKGEIAEKGDYFKVDTIDGKHYPYPNSKSFFEKKHRHIGGDEYEQINQPLEIWQFGDPVCDAIRFLSDTGKITINEDDETQYFNAFLWGAPLSAAKDATVVFYGIKRDDDGAISDVDFNFIARDTFVENYTLLTD